jgi:hypothetical protein
MKKAGIFLFLCSTVIVGCARPPQTIENPFIRITFDKKSSENPYLVRIEGRVSNRDDSAVFLDYSADMVLVGSGREFLRLNAVRKEIMPFSRAVLSAEKRFSKREFAPLAGEYKVDLAVLEKTGIADPVYLTDKQIVLEKISAKKQSILSVLKEGKK